MSDLNMWDNPFISVYDRLEIAKGGIEFRDGVIRNLRNRIDQLTREKMEIEILLHNISQVDILGDGLYSSKGVD